MDYEKKYKEALEKAKAWCDCEHATTDDKILLKRIFPELKESEDERIKKDIIDFVRHSVNRIPAQKFNKYIAWLEKQGEKIPDKIVEKARTEKQKVLLTETDGNASIDWDCRSLDDVKTLLKCGLEFIRTIEANKQTLTDSRFGGCSFRVPTRYDKGIKQGEQKPTDKVESKFKVKYAGSEYNVFETKDIAGVTFYGIEDEPNHIDYVQAENCERVDGYSIKENDFSVPTKPIMFSKQKPACSEEDEHRVKDTIYFLDTAKKHYASTVELDACINWLKSLKERIGGE